MKKQKIGFTASAFDLLHAGHILMLEEAKSVCDYLIVALQTNPRVDRPSKRKPIQSIVERQIQLGAVSYVDKIVVYETEEDLLTLLKILPIDVRIVGEDYLNKDFTGKDYCLNNNIEIYYNKRSHDFSSTELLDRIKSV
jgi:glycerol-3-phosphate cytidylyltransferase